MRPPSRRLAARGCAVAPGERVLRGALAVIPAAFAVSSLETPWFAVPAALCALFLAFGAITGWCPTQLVGRAPVEPEPNAFGHPESRRRLIP